MNEEVARFGCNNGKMQTGEENVGHRAKMRNQKRWDDEEHRHTIIQWTCRTEYSRTQSSIHVQEK